MRAFLILLFILLPFSANAFTEEDVSDEKICKLSSSCKKVCDLKLMDRFEGLPQEQKNLVVQCSQDMIKKFGLDKANPK